MGFWIDEYIKCIDCGNSLSWSTLDRSVIAEAHLDERPIIKCAACQGVNIVCGIDQFNSNIMSDEGSSSNDYIPKSDRVWILPVNNYNEY